MTFRAFCSLLLCGLLLGGCATKEKPPSAAPTASPAPSPTASPTPAPSPTPPQKKPGFSLASLSPFQWFANIMPKKKQPPVAQPPRLVGTIKMVNKEDRFVLIDSIGFSAIEPGDHMICIVNHQESANLRASALNDPPFLIADIASGNPSPGDKVFKP